MKPYTLNADTKTLTLNVLMTETELCEMLTGDIVEAMWACPTCTRNFARADDGCMCGIERTKK